MYTHANKHEDNLKVPLILFSGLLVSSVHPCVVCCISPSQRLVPVHRRGVEMKFYLFICKVGYSYTPGGSRVGGCRPVTHQVAAGSCGCRPVDWPIGLPQSLIHSLISPFTHSSIHQSPIHACFTTHSFTHSHTIIPPHSLIIDHSLNHASVTHSLLPAPYSGMNSPTLRYLV